MSRGKPKFAPGMRVVVADLEAIERYSNVHAIPMVGWVHHTSERLNGKQHMGWDVYVSRDKKMGESIDEPEYADPKYVRFDEDELQRVDLKQHGKLLRLTDSVLCPWCIEHGRDPRLQPYYIHPNIPDCQCWHHHHDSHMPACPYGGSDYFRTSVSSRKPE